MKSYQKFSKVNPLSILLPVLVLLFWVVSLSFITSSFNHLTLESERKAAIFKVQPYLPLHLVDENNLVKTLSGIAIQEHKTLVAQFIYTSCKTLCTTLGDYFQQAQTQITLQGLSDQIHLVSISFDIVKDTPLRLKSYRTRMRADERIWSLATLQSNEDLMLAKSIVGLIVLPSQTQELVHNSAFLVISSQGKLVGVFNDDDIQNALAFAVKQT
jgi:protein SCO1